jgi:hypothetical protein
LHTLIRPPRPLVWAAALLLGLGLGVALALLTPAPAGAGVPRACIHPQADPLECPRATRRVTLRVLPAARVEALREQRRPLQEVAPREDRRRNRLLEEIRDERR